ncbi:MAG: DUF503 family protein [Acidobacteria bacterium]|nr:DUF503 family protein [Acidobacteriota bacterium]
MGILTVDLHLPEAQSLKQKRREVLRVKQGLARHVGATVAEVDHHDLWQRCRISLAVVAREAGEAAEQIERASRRLATDPEWQVMSEQREVLDIGEDLS